MAELGSTPADYRHVVFHQPNSKFPQRVGKQLGFKAGADSGRAARAGDRERVCRLGAGGTDGGAGCRPARRPHPARLLRLGAGSDAFSLRVNERLAERQGLANKTQEYISRGSRSTTPPMPASAAS